MSKPGSERQREYRERMRAAGFVQVEATVPIEAVGMLRELAAKMRSDYLAKQANDD